jgi:hypothetical protein
VIVGRELGIVAVKSEPQDHVFPFDVEVHQILDVDQNWVAVPVDQDMVQAQLSVDDCVLGTRPHRCGELSQPFLQPVAGAGDSLVTPSGFG